MTTAHLGATAEQPAYQILPGSGDVDAILTVSLRQANTDLYEVLREVDQQGWELAPDRLSRIFGDLHQIGLLHNRRQSLRPPANEAAATDHADVQTVRPSATDTGAHVHVRNHVGLWSTAALSHEKALDLRNTVSDRTSHARRTTPTQISHTGLDHTPTFSTLLGHSARRESAR